MYGDKVKRKDFYLTDHEIKELEKEAKSLDLTVSEILRRIIDKHIENRNGDMKNGKNKKI